MGDFTLILSADRHPWDRISRTGMRDFIKNEHEIMDDGFTDIGDAMPLDKEQRRAAIASLVALEKNAAQIAATLKNDHEVEISARQVQRIINQPATQALIVDRRTEILHQERKSMNRLLSEQSQVTRSTLIPTDVAQRQLEWAIDNLGVAQRTLIEVISGEAGASAATRAQYAWNLIKFVSEAGSVQEEQTTHQGVVTELTQALISQILGAPAPPQKPMDSIGHEDGSIEPAL